MNNNQSLPEPNQPPMPGPEWPQSAPASYYSPDARWAPEPSVKPRWGLAVVGLLFFLPLGVWALVLAGQVGSRSAAGDYSGALQASNRVRVVSIVAIVAGVLYVLGQAAGVKS